MTYDWDVTNAILGVSGVLTSFYCLFRVLSLMQRVNALEGKLHDAKADRESLRQEVAGGSISLSGQMKTLKPITNESRTADTQANQIPDCKESRT